MKVSEEVILASVQNVRTMGEAFVKSGMKNFQTFRKYAKLYNVWKPGKGCGKKGHPSKNKIPLQDIINGIYPQYPTSKLKRRLIVEGIKEDKCEICNLLPLWNGKLLSLQLDHIDGNNTNNMINNLRIICPNCHTQTDTFGSRNIK